LGEGLSIGVHFHIADTQEKAVKEAAKYFEENLKMFGPLRLVRGLSDEQMSDMADPARAPYADLPSIEASVNGGGYLCGPPSYIVESLKRLEERYPGMRRLNVSHPIGTPQAVILEHMQIFAEEVMPAFDGVTASAAPVAADD
jgi:alkanesulfonate monooxygenase SsuD/methylene tetrahydromethanopterin reductase-like flavin-dependent oxidoreductase (luciferase family)